VSNSRSDDEPVKRNGFASSKRLVTMPVRAKEFKYNGSSFVARVNDLFGRFFQNELVLVVYGIRFCAKTTGANVVS
jgi:hypothetical protein